MARIWQRCASMSNRSALLLIISVRVEGKSKVRLFLPLPLWVVLALLDVLDDFAELAALFCGNVSYRTADGGKQTAPAAMRTVSGILTGCMWELAFETGPLDMIDIDVKGAKGAVKVKVLTR